MSQKRYSSRRRREREKRTRLILEWVAVLAVLALIVGLIVRCSRTPDSPTGDGNADVSSTTTSTTSSVTSSTATTTTVSSTSATTTASTTASTTTKTTTTTKATDTGAHYIQKDRSQWNLLLVNAWNPIDADHEANIKMEAYRSDSKYMFDARALDQLEKMMRDAGNCNLYAVSFYRSRATQEQLFKNKVQRLRNSGYTGADIEDKAATVVARAGTSEHQTGLAADILGSGYSGLTQGFDQTKAFAWLKEHCAEYGFILRYPKDKEHITGVIYEPWHYRYVGVEHATKIMQQGLCLEEYLEQIGS